MTNEEIIEITDTLNANDKTMKDNGISDNLWGKAVECIMFLQSENAKLKSSLTHANEECLKWHERAQNLLKDSGGSISGYEKKISDLQAENAALRERLDKAIEAPCEDGDIFYRFFDCPIEMKEDMACGFRKDKDGEIYVCSAYGGSWYNIKECEFSREAAETRLKELQGEYGKC